MKNRLSHVPALLALMLLGCPADDPLPNGHAFVPPDPFSFSPEERAQAAARVLSQPEVRRDIGEHRRRVLSLVREEAEKIGPADQPATLIRAVVFDYDANLAHRYLARSDDGTILLAEVLPGEPQGSSEEIDEAIALTRQDPESLRLIADGAPIESGFIVAAPPGAPPDRRYLQVRILSSDGAALLRQAVIDLSGQRITQVQ